MQTPKASPLVFRPENPLYSPQYPPSFLRIFPFAGVHWIFPTRDRSVLIHPRMAPSGPKTPSNSSSHLIISTKSPVLVLRRRISVEHPRRTNPKTRSVRTKEIFYTYLLSCFPHDPLELCVSDLDLASISPKDHFSHQVIFLHPLIKGASLSPRPMARTIPCPKTSRVSFSPPSITPTFTTSAKHLHKGGGS